MFLEYCSNNNMCKNLTFINKILNIIFNLNDEYKD